MGARAARTIEYGEFQTPPELAGAVAAFLREAGASPSVVVEPTCGSASFVSAAMSHFPNVRQIFAFDVERNHVASVQERHHRDKGIRLSVREQDFFTFDWKGFFRGLEGEILVLGNPPWITNSALGLLESRNLPEKSNFQKHAGIAAKTGKANFDISEWMLIRLIESLDNRPACIAMLCKTAVARKVLKHGWLNHLPMGRPAIHLIDAAKHFGVAASACLLVVRAGDFDPDCRADAYQDLGFDKKAATLGLKGTHVVPDIDEYERVQDLDGLSQYEWRSGVKHDAAPVMEFTKNGSALVNGIGERVELEPRFLFPLLKSSDVANGRITPTRSVLVTQRRPADDTGSIASLAPKTWSYLLSHGDFLDRRKSTVYRKRPRFSMFGIGDYTFSPWKVAVSGFYRDYRFQVVRMHENKPVVLDDTCYFFPCASEEEASLVSFILTSGPGRSFLRALTFPDAKRPLTVEVLNRLDLARLSERLGLGEKARQYFGRKASADPALRGRI